MGNVLGQMMFKASLISFLGVTMWGLLSDQSFEQVIFRAAVTALAVYITIIAYLSGIKLILRSDVKGNNNEEVGTT